MSIPSYVLSGKPQLKLALLLGAATALTTLAAFPYFVAILPLGPFSARRSIIAAVQTGVLFWVLAWIGLQLGARHGLDAPWLRALVYRTPLPSIRPRWLMAASGGVVLGVLVIASNTMITSPSSLAFGAASLAWRGLLAAFYGGTAEEILCRLFLVSSLVWLLAWIGRGRARPWMFVTAITLAALLFGLGHLPGAFAMGMPRSFIPIALIVLINALIGIFSGVLYWKLGLEHAMLAHFSIDIVIHGIWPLFMG
jgi:membrane protease YdiL (CAAX protease family)